MNEHKHKLGPRILLHRLRELMNEPLRPQERLDRITMLIAANMVAEVCSLYVLRADGALELFASEGLKRESVHKTIIRQGEGLVGLIAKEAKHLSLSNAISHPAFSYKPETGEEAYKSFLGVPVLRAGNTLGVLVIQNKTSREYTDEEIEAMLTTSMVLAELIATGELQSLVQAGTAIALKKSLLAKGQSLSDAIGLGYAVLYEPRIIVTNLLADDSTKEIERLDEALEKMRSNIDKLISGDEIAKGADQKAIFESFKLFAEDRGWANRMREAISRGLSAEAAVEKVQSDTRARMLRITDPYLRERLHDLDDLATRLLRQLVGDPTRAIVEAMPRDGIIVARSLGPAALLEFDRSKLRGLVLEEGGLTSHVAIIAKALGIAAVSQVENITSLVETGDAIIVDGVTGDVHIRPTPDIEMAYAERVRFRARRQAHFSKLKSLPNISKDGQKVSLLLNAGLLVDLPNVHECGADGVGLFRTELQFMIAPHFPKPSEQYLLYKAVFEAAKDKPVTFRTLDIGADKHLPYMPPLDEANPAIGWRAVRMGLDRPVILKTQLRAILKAAHGKDVKIMFPMVSEPAEIDQLRTIVDSQLAFLKANNHILPQKVEIGAMLEVPSLLFALDSICKRVDFLSIGSNDLMQFLFAVDRDNLRVANRFDTLNPAFLRALWMVNLTASRYNVELNLCGEMGGKPLDAIALLALGYRRLSMSPASIGPVKSMLLELDIEDAQKALLDELSKNTSSSSLREFLTQYASKRSIPI